MERIKRWKKKILGRCGGHGGRSRSRLGHWLVVLASASIVAGCTTLKKAAIVGGTTLGVSAVVSSVTAGIAPALLAGSAAAVVTSAIVSIPVKSKPILLQTGQGMIECAPDNFFSLLQSIVEYGSWFLILIFVVPMLLGWILPGPLERKRKQNP